MTSTDTIYELDDIVWRLEQMVRVDPSVIRKLKPKFKALELHATNMDRVHKLMALDGWDMMNQSMILDLATEESAPFVKVATGLAKYRYTYSPISLLMWWRRMLATSQSNVLTYFSWSALEGLHVSTVCGNDILRACTSSEAMLRNIGEALAQPKTVEFNLREALGGISASADIHEAWKKWAKANHPDKGSDAEKFVRVKIIYEEWLALQPTDTK